MVIVKKEVSRSMYRVEVVEIVEAVDRMKWVYMSVCVCVCTGARRCGTSATTTRRTLRSAASVRWSRWTRRAWCPTSCTSATRSRPGRTRKTTSRTCSRRSCTGSRTRSATRTGAGSPTSFRRSWARAFRPCAGYRHDHFVTVSLMH